MKTLVIAAAIATVFGFSASAGELAVLGGVEYAIEAETFEATAGVEYATGALTVTPVVTLDDAAGDVDFVSAEVTVDYAVTRSVSAYATVETDADWEYEETTVGLALKF